MSEVEYENLQRLTKINVCDGVVVVDAFTNSHVIMVRIDTFTFAETQGIASNLERGGHHLLLDCRFTPPTVTSPRLTGVR